MISALRLTSIYLAIALAALLPTYAHSAEDPVNYDDPNLAVTNEFAGDSATTCRADLSPTDLSRCLREKGLTAPQGVALVPTTEHEPEARR